MDDQSQPRIIADPALERAKAGAMRWLQLLVPALLAAAAALGGTWVQRGGELREIRRGLNEISRSVDRLETAGGDRGRQQVALRVSLAEIRVRVLAVESRIGSLEAETRARPPRRTR